VRNIFILGLLIIAIALSTWSILKASHTIKVVAMTDDTHQPDAFMEDVVAIMINKNGSPSLKIKAPRMIHYYEDDVTHIEKPDITVYRQSSEPWHIHAEFAKAMKGIHQIEFWNHVIIDHQSDEANPTTTITTSALTVYPNDQLANTKEAVTFLQPGTTVHGIGMNANLKVGTIKLLSAARGEYGPRS